MTHNIESEVLAYLQENMDVQFKCYQLAKIFNVGVLAMRYTLAQLDVETKVVENDRVFFIRSPAEIKRIADILARKNVVRERPKVCNRAMDIAMARCRADRGGEFHPISIS
jgi:hypothetical protein